jgi:hypothetical protein
MTTNIYSAKDFHSQVYVDENDPILTELADFRVDLWRGGYEPIPCRDKNFLNKGWTRGRQATAAACTGSVKSLSTPTVRPVRKLVLSLAVPCAVSVGDIIKVVGAR